MEGVIASAGRDAAASLIRWWRDAGVDTLVEDAPRDWLTRVAEKPAPAVRAEIPVRAPAPQAPPAPASLPDTLDALLAWLRDSADAPEARWGRTRILPAGDPQSELMILIDAPDREDAAAGRLLSGAFGELFDKMLAAIGRDRSTIWLAPFATVRPVGRVPQDAFRRLTEIARRHIGLVAPKRLLIMGDAPTRALIGTEVIPARGTLHELNFGNVMVETVATFHPRLLNERPAFKKQAWNDLQMLTKGL